MASRDHTADPRGASPPSRHAGGGGLVALFLTFALSTVGCLDLEPREDPTRFYILSAGEETEKSQRKRQGLWRVGFEAIEVAPYLAEPPMVVRQGESEVVLAEYDRWAEPLEAGILRVLRERLEATRPVETGGPFTTSDSADFEVAVRVVSCEGVRRAGSGAVLFAADWEVIPRSDSEGAESAGGRYTFQREPWDGADFDALARGLGEAVRGLGDAIAGALPRVPRSEETKARSTSSP